ncbi:mechanosensitive ion channel family protein [Candidatus Bipolaricaulota bacterium]|nr:mechanosensitive ion channel family protein [Candidatus Bipolaricaulota bacterium]
MKTAAVLNSVWDLLQKPIFTVGGEGISIISFFYFLVVIAVSIVLSRLFNRFMRRNIYSKTEIEQGAQYTLSRLIRYGAVTIGLLIGLQMIGFDLSVLAVFGGLFGVGIGFGLQNIFSNFASGLILLLERPIQVGDIVEIDGVLGKVEEIRFRVAIVNTYDNESIIVPNSDLVSKQVTNWSYGGDTSVRLRIPIGVDYGTDIEKVEDILLDISQEQERVLEDPSPQVFFKEHADSSLNFELRVWIGHPKDRIATRDAIRRSIDKRFNQAGIGIPFPQTDVHFFPQEEAQPADTGE